MDHQPQQVNGDGSQRLRCRHQFNRRLRLLLPLFDHDPQQQRTRITYSCDAAPDSVKYWNYEEKITTTKMKMMMMMMMMTESNYGSYY